MNIAVIDMGTNTFDLLIAQVEKGIKPKELFSTKSSVRLGSGGITKNQILDDAIERALITLREYKKKAASFDCSNIYAFGTSAIRGAENKDVFLSIVKAEIGIDVFVIDGNKEAELIYEGVKHALDIGSDRSLIMDIGGGSIEFIIANRDQVFWKHSFNIGVARIIERFRPSDPITPEELDQIEKNLNESLTILFDAAKVYPIAELIGSSGSFDTFAEIIANKMYTPDVLKDKTEYVFEMGDYNTVHHQLVVSSLEERKQMKGIIEMRLDMIVMASIVTNLVLKKLNIQNMRLSTYSLKEGVLWEAINNSLN